MKEKRNNSRKSNDDFLAGGGELGELIRAKDWSQTALGPAETWPQSLQSALSICLGSAFPIAIYWGIELTLLYNDAWSPIPGNKHPWAVGEPAKKVWPEIWENIGPLFKEVFETGKASRNIDALLPMQRHGYTEECYFDFTFTPIRGAAGKVEGIFNAVIETTYRYINERRTNTLRELADYLNRAKAIDEIFTAANTVLAKADKDLPFSFIYLISDEGLEANKVAATGAKPECPASVTLKSTVWPFAEIIETGRPLLRNNSELFGQEVESAWPEPSTETLIIPIGSNKVIGFFIAGINPRRALDKDYRVFLESIASHFSNTLNNIQSLEQERKRAEALAEIDRAKTLFFSNVSHEFRTPLTLMLGPLRDMLDEPDVPEHKEQLEVVHRNGLRLQKLVNTLLDFSRLEAGRIRANYMPTDLAKMTAELASNFRSAIEKAGMKLIVKTAELSEDVFVDRDMWEKIVLNLLSNAFKFTFKGKIEVILSENKKDVTLTIKDTGEGIPQNDLQNIFERFKRVEGAKSRTFEGSGIGLSLVQELVKLHRGSIKVKSKVGEETAFIIKLPKGKAHLPQDQIKTEKSLHSTAIGAKAFIEEIEQWQPAKQNTQKKGQSKPDGVHPLPGFKNKPRIVLADDNADMRQYVQHLLSERFEVITTANGKEALAAIKKEIPDLLLTDVMMPEMDGFSLLSLLKSNPETARIPVILLSARAGEEARLEGIEAGADDYLTKPFSSNELVARVSALATARRTRYEAEDRLYKLLVQAPAFIAVLQGPDHVFELANSPYQQLVGKDRKIIGKPISEALPEVKGQEFLKLLEKAFETGEPVIGTEIPAKLDRSDKGELEEVYLNFVYHPLKNSEGSIEGVLAHGIDITPQVLARKKVEETERKLSAIVNQATVGIVQTDMNGNFELVNDRFCEIVGHSREELMQKTITDVTHPDDKLVTARAYQQMIETGQNFRIEKRYIRKDGREVWVHKNVSLIKDVDAKPVAMLSVIINITEKKKAEEELRYHATISENIADAVVGTDIYYRIKSWNKGAEKLYGWKAEEILGKTVEEVLGTKVTSIDNLNEIREALVNIGFWRGEAVQNHKNGHSIPVFASVAYVKDNEEKPLGVVAVNRDISEQKRAEEALRQSEQLFKTFAEAMPQMAFIADAQGKMIYYNQRWYEFVGGMEGTEGWGWKDKPLHHPDDLERTIARWNESIETGKPYEIEYRLRNYKGEFRWHLGRALPVRDPEGKIEKWLGTNTDIHEQKQTEQALQQVKDQLTITFQNVPSGIMLYGKNGEVIFGNKLGAYYQGFNSVEEILAQKNVFEIQQRFIENFVVEDERGKPIPPERSVTRRALQGEKGAEITAHYYDKRKEKDKWILARATPIFDENGEVQMALLSITDITEQKRAEKALRKSEEYYKTMTDNTPVMTWITQPDGYCSFLNKQWYDYTGQDPTTGLGFGWLQAVHTEDKEMSEKILLQANKKQIPFKYEFRLKGKDGQYRWHIDTGLPKFDTQGNFEGFIGSVIDIHERKMAEQKLQESEENLKLAVQVSDLGTWEFWPRSGYIYWSDRCKDLFGLPADVEVDYKLFFEGLHPEDRDRIYRQGLNAMRSADDGKIDLEFRTIGVFDKDLRWLRAKGQAYFDNDGKAIKLLGTVVDITTQREAEEALNQSHQRLQRLVEARTRELVTANNSLQRTNSELNRFAYVTSHDLKAPLRGISTIATWLKEDYSDQLDENGQEQLMLMQQRVKRMYSLIDGILHYSRAGRSADNVITNVDIHAIIEEVKSNLNMPAGFKITYSQKLPVIKFDSVKVYQVFQNLISNAIKFNDQPPGKGEVKIKWEENNKEYVFVVSDNGPGIPSKYHNKIFELFQTLGTTTDEEQSTGLGLAIIKKIVEVGGGRIWMESEEGKGASFYFTIPKVPVEM